ncbi:hypothetical protein [Amycolatopsis sp. NPDC004169]|uniref:hypothetical protein n=1 Tax=Amycolatopsis sp. NPDC004169 TaxID=3154453 RepID=UPI0033B0CCD1
MGRHYRDEEPVPHPQDRTPRVPAEGRSETSGAFRTPGRSSISDAFGIARVPGESAGSVFFTEGAQAPGFPPAADGPAPRRGEKTRGPRRGDASGAHPVTSSEITTTIAPGPAAYPAAGPRASRRGEASGSYPVAASEATATRSRRGEATGAHPAAGAATRRGETSGSYPVAGDATATRASRRGEASGSYPVAGDAETGRSSRRGEASGSYPTVAGEAGRRGETSGSYPVAAGDATATRASRRGEATGAHPAADKTSRRGEATGAHPVADTTSRRGESSGAHPAAPSDATAPRSPRRGEATGAHPAAAGEPSGAHPAAGRGDSATGAFATADPTARSRRKGAPVPDRVEAPGRPTRAGRRAEAADPGAPRSRRKNGKAPAESAAERTEVITRQEEVTTRDETTPAEDTGSRAAIRSERTDSTGPHRAGRDDSTGPNRTARSEGTGSHRIVGKTAVGKGDVTGSHRIVGKKAPRRRIATWPIACAVLAVLIGLGVVGWNWADNELNSRAEAQASSCDGGTANMRVVVTPSVQKPVAAAAQRWNQAATVVHGQCVHIVIEAKPSAQVLDALVGRAKLDTIGGLPAAWLPESSYWVSELTTKKPEMIGSPAQSVANARSADYPFIGLAGPGVDDTALRAAQTFREYLEQPAQQADFAAAGIKAT